MNILICGDSFAADWRVKNSTYAGWPAYLENNHIVKNNAQAGCSEYKIFKQLANENVKKFDAIIISHTSPYRIPVEKHPILQDDILHKNADLLYTDIKSKNNPSLDSIVYFFENFFDLSYADFVHELIIKEQQKLLEDCKSLHISYYWFSILDRLVDNYCFEQIFQNNKGNINHMNDRGNKLLANIILNWIEKGKNNESIF